MTRYGSAAQYLDRERTLDDLAGEIDCHDSTLRLHLARHGIRKHHDIDEAWLRREYVDRGRTQQDIADELCVNIHVVARARERFGIEAPDRRRANGFTTWSGCAFKSRRADHIGRSQARSAAQRRR